MYESELSIVDLSLSLTAYLEGYCWILIAWVANKFENGFYEKWLYGREESDILKLEEVYCIRDELLRILLTFIIFLKVFYVLFSSFSFSMSSLINLKFIFMHH